ACGGEHRLGAAKRCPRGGVRQRLSAGPGVRERAGGGKAPRRAGDRRRALGEVVVARGEVWWGETPEEKGRPFLVISRDATNRVMQRVLVAPVTSRIRGIPSELPLGEGEGLPLPSVATFHN